MLVCASLAYGAFLLAASRMNSNNAFTTILGELDSMSASMRWLALVQFCSWFTLFAVFVYTTPAVAKMQFGGSVAGAQGYEAAANWVGVLFATYNGLAAGAAMFIPYFVRRHGLRRVHRVNLWIGAAGLLSMLLIREPEWLLVSMVGLGLRVGLHHRLALRDARQQPSVAEDGREHRHLQYLHRDPAAARRERAAARCSTCSPAATLPLRWSSAPSAGSSPGSRCSASSETAAHRA